MTCISNDELVACWDEYQHWPEVVQRVQSGGPALRPGSNDVFDINGIVAQKIFEKNKKDHTFYIEQSVPITWMYPYLMPSGLIFKLNNEPLTDADFAARGGVEEDRKFWDAYSKKLLTDPRFRIDSDAILTFGKLAFWHSDLYRWRHMEKEQEYWLRMSLALCPQLQDAVNSLAHLLMDQKRFDEAIAVVQQAEVDDPRNEQYVAMLGMLTESRLYGKREQEVRDALAKSPYDVGLNIDLARLLQDEGKFPELDDRLRTLAGLTNWDHDSMAQLIQYYVDQMHNPDAAIAFLAARVKIDPTSGELFYTLATLEATAGRPEDSLKYLSNAVTVGGTNAITSAKIDPRFAALRNDPRFQALLAGPPATNTAPANSNNVAKPAVNPPSSSRAKPVQM